MDNHNNNDKMKFKIKSNQRHWSGLIHHHHTSPSAWCCWLMVTIVAITIVPTLVVGQCPWPRTPLHVSLHSDCVCGYSNVRRLSVQCSPMANFSQLLEVLNSPSVQRLPIDLLYINNATGLTALAKNSFKKLDIQQIHLANTYLEKIDKDAFAGLEDKLQSLTFQNVGLKEVPAPIKQLRSLRTLDLSNNRIRRIRPKTFEELAQLTTLKLSFNHDLHLDPEAFVGLSRTLKNLDLKGINLKQIPDAILNLTELAFLDLAQNKIEEIKPRRFKKHHLLTALSLERNLIRSMHPDTFVGLNDSLSSLSLLNNMLIEFPLLALSKLTGLRVLDLGFNAIRQLPDQAFRSNELLTLLALDGNPIKTLSLQTFKHLNNSLRGLSVGGKSFECDCKVRWLAEWAIEYSLQITSRERNPQFCAKPPHLRNKPFTHIDLNDFVCAAPPPPEETPVSPMPPRPTSSTSATSSSTLASSSSLATTKVTPTSTITTASSARTTTTTMASTTLNTTTAPNSQTTLVNASPSTTPLLKPITSYVHVVPMNDNSILRESTPPSQSSSNNIKSPSKPISTTNRSMNVAPSDGEQQKQSTLKLIDAHFRNGTVLLRWEPLKSTQDGYQILYRYFGTKEFFHSDRLKPDTQSYTLDKFISPNELLIVCVINLDQTNDLLEYDEGGEASIPHGQCRELNTREPPILKKANVGSGRASTSTGNTVATATTSLSSFYPSLKRLNDIDKIVIGISAAVCVFIIIAVLIFSCCFYRSSSKDSPLRTLTTNAHCLSTKSLSPLAKSGYHDPEWETISVYSTRSIPRARIGPPTTLNRETLRSQMSNHNNGQYQHPVQRYLGSTLPPPQRSSNYRAPWLDSYLHHYPSVNQLPAITFGSTVTGNGGNGIPTFNNPNSHINGGYSMDTFGGIPVVERSKSHRHPNRPRGKSNKQRQQQHQQQQFQLQPNLRHQHSKSHIDLRSNAGSNGSNGSSTNRLLLSSTSTSNSYQSQQDYDSDHWNNSGRQSRAKSPSHLMVIGTNHHPPPPLTTNLPTTSSHPTGNSRTNLANDHEVDIYIDQNYAKRFY